MTKIAPEPAYTLRFSQLARQIPAAASESIFASARRHGVRIVGACGGRGVCGTCLVHVVEGAVAESGATPEAHSVAGKKWVRACRVRARADCTLEVAPRSLAAVVRAEVETDDDAVPAEPAVQSVDLSLAAPTLADNLSDVDRVLRALPEKLTVDLAAARQLPAALRDGHWAVRARRRGDELIGFAPLASATLGLAVDLGTSNVAAFLLDLESGRRLASLGIENPQAAWGADLISRINAAAKSPAAAEQLRAAALAAINALAADLCRAIGAATEHIVDVVICGNTAMHHLLLGLPVAQLGRSPFVAALRDGVDLKARELGLAFCPGAYVHVAANVGGFVGGDHVCALLASERHWRAATSLVMDIGTNTEISLLHEGRILSASCPSGPALEGGHIACGMRAAAGAIERVGLADGRLRVEVIGDEAAIGLCGSGVLDAVAVLHRAGIVDDRGRLAGGHPDVADQAGKRVAVLAPGVHFSQDDVRAVQLAKSAIRSGVELLLGLAELHESDIERFVIAGAFGAYIDVASAIAIGLLPPLPRRRFTQVGNAAGAGVRQMLASRTARARASELAARCRYVELSTLGGFQKTFLKHLGFNASSRNAS